MAVRQRAAALPTLMRALRKEAQPRNQALPSLRRAFSLYDQINLITEAPEDQLRFQGYWNPLSPILLILVIDCLFFFFFLLSFLVSFYCNFIIVDLWIKFLGGIGALQFNLRNWGIKPRNLKEDGVQKTISLRPVTFIIFCWIYHEMRFLLNYESCLVWEF